MGQRWPGVSCGTVGVSGQTGGERLGGQGLLVLCGGWRQLGWELEGWEAGKLRIGAENLESGDWDLRVWESESWDWG